jgi:pre-mRNA-processing factor SLU7
MSRQPPKPPTNENNGRNEYIPSFISKAPFYATGTDEDYLEHQRLQSLPTDTLDKAKWYSRGQKAAPAATKFRKGACENCGAMTHKTKECLSRPRKQGAKWTGKDIQADEVVEEVKLGWDAKRDRWNGYDAREYSAVVAEYEELEAAKRTAKPSTSDQALLEDGDTDADETRYAEETDMGRSQPTSTRQLRLREDTAKYLLNLDLESARYDPKTRSMDTAPTASDDASDGFVRPQLEGDAASFERAQRYAWETQEGDSAVTSSKKLHLQANPTEGEVLLKKQTTEAAARKEAQRKLLLEKYGENAASVPDAATKKLLVQENEKYVEYDDSGAVKGAIKDIARSKYPEDVYINNHTSVFGSWWSNFQWGYACCHSFVKNSYCTGEDGRLAFENAEKLRLGELLIENGDAEENERLKLEQNGEDVQERKKEAMADTEKPLPKKRTLKEMREGITEEEIEGYKRNRVAANDPMAKMLGKDELVH